MKRSVTLAGGTMAAVAALAFAAPQLAVAEQSPSPERAGSQASPQSGSPQPGSPQSGPPAERGDRPTRDELREELATRLAEELGLEPAEVSAALETVEEELRAEHETERLERLSTRLDEAVEAGRLTRDQADAILEAARQGELVGGHGHRGPGGHLGGPHGDDDGGSTEDSVFRS